MESNRPSERSEVAPTLSRERPFSEAELAFIDAWAKGQSLTSAARAAGFPSPHTWGPRAAKLGRFQLAVERRRFELSPDWPGELDAHVQRLGNLRDKALADGKHRDAIEAERLIGLALGHQPRPAGAQLGVQLNMPGGAPRDLPPGWADALARSS